MIKLGFLNTSGHTSDFLLISDDVMLLLCWCVICCYRCCTILCGCCFILCSLTIAPYSLWLEASSIPSIVPTWFGRVTLYSWEEKKYWQYSIYALQWHSVGQVNRRGYCMIMCLATGLYYIHTHTQETK